MPITYYPTFKNSSGNVGIGTISPGFRFDIKATTTNSTTTFALRNSNDSYNFIVNDGGTASAGADFRAPIFYDSNNTAYYLDPASTSNLVGLTVANTITGSISGNAATATTLQTARTINGTSFNGSANITTSSWGTARTLTIGSTGKSVDGSAAVSWSLAEIGALPLSGGQITGNTTFSADNHLTFGPNSTWGSSIRIGGNGYTATGTEMASVVTTDGNLHLDAAKSTNGIYLNWYGGTSGVFFGNGSAGQAAFVSSSGNAVFNGSVTTTYGNFTAPALVMGDAQYGFYVVSGNVYYKSASGGVHYWRNIANSANTMSLDNSGSLNLAADVRAPIFYDSNDTAYYLNPADVSYLYEPRMAYRTLIGAQSYDATLFETPVTTRPGIVVRGSYPHIEMVAAGIDNVNHGATLRFVGYDTGGATTGNFKHWVIGCPATNLTGLYFGYSPNQTNPHYGIGRGWSSGNDVSIFWILNDREVYAENGVRATIFYDRNNTAYYCDPASNSRVSQISTDVGTAIYLGNQNVSTSSRTIINWHSDADYNYLIGKRAGAWTQPMDIAFYTGIRYHAHQFYNAHIFYVTGYDSGEAFSIGKGDAHVRVVNNLYVPIIYDTNDTGYYIDPASTSNLGTVYAIESYARNWFRNVDSGEGLYNESSTQHFYSDSVNYWNIASSASAQGLRFRTGGYNGAIRGYIYADTSNSIGFLDQSGNWKLRVVNGDYSLADGSSMRAQIFYDTNDTSYYCDPASTSSFATLSLAGTLQFGGNINWNHGVTTELGRKTIGFNIWQGGKKLNADEDFNSGTNNITVYNNNGGTALTITRTALATAPNSSGQVLRVAYAPGSNGTSPGFGGFYFATQTAANKVFVTRFVANIPTGRSLAFHSNAYGTNSNAYWLSNNVGTGKWEEYVFVVMCGNTGTFSSTNFFAVSGGADTAFSWDIASATVFDITNKYETVSRAITADLFVSSPIFYDQNNTAYYIDPASTSVLNALTVGGNNVLTTTSTLTAGNLSGTIPSAVLGNSTVNIGTTAIALNRGSGSQTLTGVSIDGNAANVTGTVAVANGGTGATTAANARTNLGATTVGGNLFTLTNPSAITFIRVNADNTVSALDAATFRTAIGAGTGSVTSVGGTGTVSGLTLTGTVTTTGNLTLGGTLSVTASNFASQTANTFLAAPNGTAGVPTFRTIVAADIPTLNQNTTGTAANVTGTVAIANGGTGNTTAQAAINALAGAVTSGQYLRGNGTNVVMSAIQAADVPTLNQNTTGTASNITAFTINQNLGTANSPTFADLFTTGQYQIRNASPTITLRDTDHRTGYIHVNSNIFYVLTGPADSASGGWSIVANSRWPLEINLSNNNATFGGDVNAISLTAPIFYDANNTAYYCDPASTSILNVVNNRENTPGGSGNTYFWSGSAMSFYWTKIANVGGGNTHAAILITYKTDVNYNPFGLALLSVSAFNSQTFSVKLEKLNGDSMQILVRVDNNNDVWLLTAAEWSSYKTWKVISKLGSPTVYYSSLTEQLTTPANSIEIASGQEVRGTQGAATSATVSTVSNHLFGGLTVRSDVRAPIFYDTDDTAYLGDFASRRVTSINGFTARTKMTLGLTAKYQLDRADYTGDGNYWTGVMGWGTTDFNTMITWGSGFIDSWSSPGNSPGTYTHFVGIQSLHYTNGDTDGTDNYGYQLVAGGGTTSPLYLRVNWGSAGSWRTILDSSNYNSYSPTLTGTGASGSWGISITGSSASCTGNAATATTATSSGSINSDTGNVGGNRLQYWQVSGNTTLNPDGEWYNAIRMGHGDPVTYYSNTLAVKMTGSNLGDIYTRTTTNGTAGTWNRFWNNNNDGAGSGLDADLLDGINSASFLRSDVSATNSVDLRSPVFYDSSDTAYFLDLNSSGSLIRGRVNITGGHSNSSLRVSLAASENGASTGIATLQQWCSEPGNTWEGAGFGYNVDNNLNEAGNVPAYFFGRPNTNFGQAYMRMLSDGNWYFYNTPNGSNTRYTTMVLERTGYVLASNSIRSPIFYDSDNTAYYCDPSSTSNLVGLTVANTITGNITGNAGGSSASCSGNAATATILQTARTIGGVSFNGSANINLPGVNTAGNQNTTGTAANVTGTVAVANGGTGATTAANAATNLGLGTGNTPKFVNVFGERTSVTASASTTVNTQFNVTELTMSASITTLTLSNIQANNIVHMWTIVTLGNGTAYSITWPAAVKWPGGTAPTITSTNAKRDIYQFVTYDGGTNIYAIIVGQNL